MCWVSTRERVAGSGVTVVPDVPPQLLEREEGRWRLVGRGQAHRDRVLIEDTKSGIVCDVPPARAREYIGKRNNRSS